LWATIFVGDLDLTAQSIDGHKRAGPAQGSRSSSSSEKMLQQQAKPRPRHLLIQDRNDNRGHDRAQCRIRALSDPKTADAKLPQAAC
jgi:hypothetical protein